MITPKFIGGKEHTHFKWLRFDFVGMIKYRKHGMKSRRQSIHSALYQFPIPL